MRGREKDAVQPDEAGLLVQLVLFLTALGISMMAMKLSGVISSDLMSCHGFIC
jgi:hypothetical protein